FFAKFDEFYHLLDRIYRRVLAWALGHRRTVVLGGFGALLVMLMIAGLTLKSEFFPRMDNGQVTVTAEMPTGASLDATNAVVTQIEDMASKIPEVENIFTSVGSTTSGFRGGESGANYGEVTCSLRVKESALDRMFRPFLRGERRRVRSDQEIRKELQETTAAIPGGRIKVQVTQAMGGGASPFDIELTGPDVEELNTVAQQIRSVVASNEGILNADVSWKVGKPEVRAIVDRVRAADMGFSVGQIAQALRTSVAGSTDTHFRQGGKEYDIRVRLKEFDRYSLADVGRVVIGSIDSSPVFLQDVAKITQSSGPTKIERKNRQRKVSVTADLEQGYALQNVQTELEKKIAGVHLGNASIYLGGQSEHMRESMGDMQGALRLVVALVYMLMAALFESLFSPFIIMFSLPMALIGALLAIVATGQTMNMVTMIGIIMLMGLVTKIAILLVDYTNTCRGRGMERNEAILEAGPTRLRPILMTTFAMIFGMLPTALRLGRGSEMRSPMAIAVIGGLIVSTLLTLVMIPVLYTFFDDLMVKYQRRKQSILDKAAVQK
ncbi:MAG: efflux RND transporter permease subunit, partial [Armatimonadetes bacterium]|nr:efflux RND transporter permease subunit [Armatimonadota bacterium]